MFSVRVMPVAKGIFKDHLTYFSREHISPGTVIHATVRGRKIPGIVLSSIDVREEKYDLRAADFALKKLDTEKTPKKKMFRASFIRAVHDAAEWHGTHEGIVVSTLASSQILASLPSIEEYVPKAGEETTGVKADLLVLQAEREERIRTYRNLAREAFARGASVFIVAPTIIEAEQLAVHLERGIENRVILFTSELSKKKLIGAWNHAVTNREPVLVVGTPVILSIPRSDLDTIVIERESARAYRGRERPYLDVRQVAESLSAHSGARLILADFPLRVETRYRVDIHEAEELARSQVRPGGTEQVSVIDTRPKDTKRGERRMFSALTTETKAEIKTVLKKGGRAIVFAARKGIAPLTICNDCGTPITDPNSGLPMTLHKTANGNVFLSHRSGAALPAETSCTVCGGWNLVTLGIGIDRVVEELEKEFPEAKISSFTKDTAPTHKAAKKLADTFFATEENNTGAILVGTERMLPYLKQAADIAVVASIDTLLSLPAWRAHETALSILFYLREHAEEKLIIETRQPDTEVMKTLLSGNPLDFYRKDCAEREQYGYPPFTLFIGLTAYGPRPTVDKTRTLISETFSSYDLVGPLPAEAEPRSEWSAKAVIRLPKTSWPDAELWEKLKNLPPNVAVTIDPDEIV
jgi:primosomal protein N' (replication factor Y)